MDKKRFRVDFWEYERGWGAKIDFIEYFDTYEEADERAKKFNSGNTAKEVPDWYMVAQGPYDTHQ